MLWLGLVVMLLCADAGAGQLLQRYIPSVMFSHALPGQMKGEHLFQHKSIASFTAVHGAGLQECLHEIAAVCERC